MQQLYPLYKAILSNRHNLFLQEYLVFPYGFFVGFVFFLKEPTILLRDLLPLAHIDTFCHGFNLHSPMNIWLAIAFIISSFVI